MTEYLSAICAGLKIGMLLMSGVPYVVLAVAGLS